MKPPKKVPPISSISKGRAAKGSRVAAETAMKMSNRLANTAFTNARLEGGNTYQGTPKEKIRTGKSVARSAAYEIKERVKSVVAKGRAKKKALSPKGK